jgi:dihydroorotase
MTDHRGSLLVKNGRVVDSANGFDGIADVLIRDGKIAQIAADLPAKNGPPILDASDLIVAPGFIDIHVHLRQPGGEHKETIASGTAAAAAGGICSVVAMPNTQPPPDSAEHLREMMALAAGAAVRYYPIACITQNRDGKKLAPMEELAAGGAVAFSDDGDPVENEELMRQALICGRRLGIPMFPHEEVKAITAGGCMHEGEVSARLGVKGMPATGEEVMIARDIELVRETGGLLHIAHISTAGAVDLVRHAKLDGLPITCEVLPHHFILTDSEVERQGTAAKMSPPLRAVADVEAMLAGLQDNTIDLISTDHAPHTAAEKLAGLEAAPFGIVGLETAIGLTFTYLVEAGVLEVARAIEKWTSKPAKILNLPGGNLDLGNVGDLTLIDPLHCWTVDSDTFVSLSDNTPFDGYELRGKAVATVVGGTVVYNAVVS